MEFNRKTTIASEDGGGSEGANVLVAAEKKNPTGEWIFDY